MATETGTEASTPDYAQGEAAAIARDLSTQEWVPFIDWSQTHPGNRGVNRQGRYELYDAPVGVRIRVEQAAKSDPVLTSNDRWEGEGNMVPLRVWRDGGTYKMLYGAYPHRRDDKSPGLGGGLVLGLPTIGPLLFSALSNPEWVPRSANTRCSTTSSASWPSS